MNESNIKNAMASFLSKLPSSFEDAGLEFRGSATGANGDSVYHRYEFVNNKSGVVLEISIGITGNGLLTFLKKEGKRSITEHEWLHFFGRDKEYEDKFFGKELAQYLVSLAELVGSDWKGIILGTKWEDIPLDWEFFVGK